MVGTAVQRIAHCDEDAMAAAAAMSNMSNGTSGGGGGTLEGCGILEVDIAVTLALMVGILMVSVCCTLFHLYT